MINPNIVFAALLAATLASSCLQAQPFFFRNDIPVGLNPRNAIIGDFNGDGRPDLAVNTWEGGGVFILLNQGGGNFARPISAPSVILAVADFNGDGRDDVVTIVGVMLSRGDGTFLPPRPSGNIVGLSDIQVGNFNRDDKPDLLVIQHGPTSAEQVRVWLGNGDGTFRPGEVIANPGDVMQAVVADFNRDGLSDAAVFAADSFGRPLVVSARVFLGKGDGTFGPAIQTQMDARGLLVSDFNGDGLPDFATLSCVVCAPGTTGVFLGKGDGSFHPPVPYPSNGVAPYPSKGVGDFLLTAADFTGDGMADLAVGGGSNAISIYPGKGDGTFLPAVMQAVGWSPGAATAADLDGDGRLDLVTANDQSNTISVPLGKVQVRPELQRAVSAASETAIVAAESLATLFAPTTATAGETASLPWPTRLGGISLAVRDSAGETRLAPLLFVSPTQINFQVPAETALGEATLAAVADSGSTPIGSMLVDTAAPGLFLMSHFAAVPAATAVRVEADGTQVPVPVFSCSGNSCKLKPVPLSAAGSRPIYLSFFGTGFRGASPANVTCTISGVQVPVLYAGQQGEPGLDQINVRLLPETLTIIGGDVIIRMNGVAANGAFIDAR